MMRASGDRAAAVRLKTNRVYRATRCVIHSCRRPDAGGGGAPELGGPPVRTLQRVYGKPRPGRSRRIGSVRKWFNRLPPEAGAMFRFTIEGGLGVSPQDSQRPEDGPGPTRAPAATPALYPMAIDPRADAVQFMTMTEADYAAASFLDARMLPPGTT